MSESQDAKFSLSNENTVATFGADLGSDAEQAFGDLVCGGYIGSMATDVRARALGQEMAATGINTESGLTGKQSLSVLMIPHTFNLRPVGNDLLRKKVDSVGVLIEFQPGDHPFSLEELLPNSSFEKVLEAKILCGQSFAKAPAVTLEGPGIKTQERLMTRPLPPVFWDQVVANNAQFPRGVDLIFAGDGEVTALPRSTRIVHVEA